MDFTITPYNFANIATLDKSHLISPCMEEDFYSSIDNVRLYFSRFRDGYLRYLQSQRSNGKSDGSTELFYINISLALQHNKKYISIFRKIDLIINEQITYINRMTDSNLQWYILLRYKGEPYGGIFLFQSVTARTAEDGGASGGYGSGIFLMQAICKYHIPMIYQMLNSSPLTAPSLQPLKAVSTNSLLIPYIEEFARQRGGRTLYVTPLEVQREILLNKHGFISKNNARKDIRNLMDVQTYFGGSWLKKNLLLLEE